MILAGARRYFFAHGFRRVTMDDLAAELGMSKKTLYAWFPSKHDLLRAIILKKLGEVDAELTELTASPPDDFLADLHSFLAGISRHSKEITPEFLRDMHREPPEFFELIQTRRQEMIRRHFQVMLSRGRSKGIIRKDIPATLIMEILLGAVQSILNPAKMMELNMTPKTGFAAIIRVVMEGVLVSKSRSVK